MRLSPLVVVFVLATAALSACAPGPDRLSSITALSGQDGTLHVAARLRSGEGEGGGSKHRAYLYAHVDGTGQTIRAELPALAGGNDYCDEARLLLVEGQKSTTLAIEGAEVSAWQIDATGSFRQASPAPLPVGQQSLYGLRLRGAWRETTGPSEVVDVLTDQRLFRVEGDAITSSRSVGEGCASGSLCHVLPPTPSEPALAAVLGAGGVVLRTLDCSATDCAWTDGGVLSQNGDLGGSSCLGGRFLLGVGKASEPRTPVFLRLIQPPNKGATYALLASSPAGDRVLRENGAYFFGAAALPDGGYAVAVEGYDQNMQVIIVAADLQTTRSIDLGRRPYDFMNNTLTVLGSGSAGDPRVHVLYGVGSATLRHLTIETQTDTVQSDALVGLR